MTRYFKSLVTNNIFKFENKWDLGYRYSNDLKEWFQIYFGINSLSSIVFTEITKEEAFLEVL